MTDEKKEFNVSELNEEANKSEKKNDKKTFNKASENPVEVLKNTGAQAIVSTMVKEEEKEVKFEKPQKEVQKEEFSKPETPKQEARVESNPKKKGKVISIGKTSIVVRGEKGEGIRLFGYKNVKIGDTVLY